MRLYIRCVNSWMLVIYMKYVYPTAIYETNNNHDCYKSINNHNNNDNNRMLTLC